jgi:hypothetical protein
VTPSLSHPPSRDTITLSSLFPRLSLSISSNGDRIPFLAAQSTKRVSIKASGPTTTHTFVLPYLLSSGMY